MHLYGAPSRINSTLKKGNKDRNIEIVNGCLNVVEIHEILFFSKYIFRHARLHQSR